MQSKKYSFVESLTNTLSGNNFCKYQNNGYLCTLIRSDMNKKSTFIINTASTGNSTQGFRIASFLRVFLFSAGLIFLYGGTSKN